VHQLGPLVLGNLDGGDRGDELGGRLARTGVLCRERVESELLDVVLDLGVQAEPPLLDLT